jgi:ribonuclease P protein component
LVVKSKGDKIDGKSFFSGNLLALFNFTSRIDSEMPFKHSFPPRSHRNSQVVQKARSKGLVQAVVIAEAFVVPAPTRKTFPRKLRLSGARNFERVFEARCSASDGHLVVYAVQNGLSFCRIGLSVSRKFGPAVRRNRIKRLIRESFRLSRQALPDGFDLVCVPRVSEQAELSTIRESLLSVASRAIARARSTRQ